MDVDEPPPPEPAPDPPVVEHPVDILPPPPPPPPSRPSRPPPPQKPKIPRPIKLKPLKEVLRRLITQIKRKDDYAFFLSPVDPVQVAGYTDVVKSPMDFGTMTEKIEQGRYRSLEQFKDDFLLVTSNAKTFNPPPSLYHSEASKIEAWSLDQITRASAQVIEYETDWTIDVVADEGPKPADAEPTDNGPIDSVANLGETPAKTRSPSVMSSAAGTSNMPAERTKKGLRGKKVPVVTESWEEGGHLPGFKDGLGVFPSGSEFAALMLELKLRGKRFRTKKERLKREKEGPPSAADGSLDYTEMENPYTVLRSLAPKPLAVPELIPLINTRSTPIESIASNPDASLPPEEKQDVRVDGPVSFPPESLPAILSDPSRHAFVNPPTATTTVGKKKLRHWTITRNPPRATRAKEEEDDSGSNGPRAKRRRIEHTDFGTFASLLGTVAAENGLRAEDFEEIFSSDEKVLQQIRQNIESRERPSQFSEPLQPEADERERLLDADEYVRDIVYGGVDGLAYFRSLAEFVGEYHGPLKHEGDMSAPPGELGMPLAQWVASRIVDPLTLGNHATLRAAAETLARANAYGQKDGLEEASAHASHAIARYLALTREDKSSVMEQLRELEGLADPGVQIDISSLLRKPEELFLAENEWTGREREQQQNQPSGDGISAESAPAPITITSAGTGVAALLGLGLASTLPGQSNVPDIALASGASSAIEHALNASGEALRELGRRTLVQERDGIKHETEDDVGDVEDPLMRRTRLTLIALAKRAPIDRIARLPPELVPVHIRHIVPTIGS
ncbi:uncharacterized protein FOMMEDRAFT_128149 [Fomitiporia mediterranea MF3/22]|uniref:uncharacterized protein n=1 Tax=Fomitiporia mediterranea (strain MF3/22) TaxID=694068 RepID=UPI0004408399|nr:uncharacterized protein FOMMEDRAFT_128149 [Fomitiporia mediterranea MF3/22]EJC99522.1 hypothetical protein FOMMEDRAFT_128149 [Fomitiporia mediterranea MF3/22]